MTGVAQVEKIDGDKARSAPKVFRKRKPVMRARSHPSFPVASSFLEK